MSAHPHIRRNFWMHCLEGGFYMAGLAFISPEMVMPSFVKSLGGSDNLVAQMPVLLPAAFATLGLFVAPLIERLHCLKPFVVCFGFFQRIPYLIAALLMFLMPHAGAALLPIVVLTPVMSGLVGGVGVNAWMEMVTRMIPEHLRASGWAIRYLIQGVMGIAAGVIIRMVLKAHADAEITGYAWLHLVCFGFLVLSALAQIMMKEIPPPRAAVPHSSYKNYLRELPHLLRSQPQLIRFILARFTGMGYLMLVARMSIHALVATGRPDEDKGLLLLASAVGSLFGNVIAGLRGNRHGGRAVMLMARALCLALCLVLPLINNFTGFLGAFFLLGFGLFVDRVGDLTFSAELCPIERRPTYLAILAFFQAISLITAAWLSGLAFQISQNFLVVAALSGAFALVSLVILRTIPEVRGKGADGRHVSPAMGETPPMM